MKCRFEHEGDCFNCGSSQYMYRCKPEVCHSAVPTTNADRIRSMSDEELAKLLCCTGWRMIEQKECLEWLQHPCEVGE